MHRYYTDSQTRDALIAESKRLIETRAANAAAGRSGSAVADPSWAPPPLEPAPDSGPGDLQANSVFAALVSELWSVSSHRSEPLGQRDLAR